MLRTRSAKLAILTLLAAAAAIPAAASVEIPLGEPPSIDGEFSHAEWAGATRVEFTANEGRIAIIGHLLQSACELYVAFEFAENPDGEIVIPEILIDPDNSKAEAWEPDDWWFHVSAQNCDAEGGYDDYSRCALRRPNWIGRPNFAPDPHSVPLPAIEIRIPFWMVGISSEAPFGLTLSALAFPSETRGSWPTDAEIDHPSTWGEASLEPIEGVIAFDSDRDGDADIYVMGVDGARPIQLTNMPGDDTAPAWSPDGTTIAFSTAVYGYAMRLDGSELLRLPRAGQMSWSPDGERIVLVQHGFGDAEVFVMNADGSGLTQLTDNDVGDYEPTWLPNSREIGFSSGFSESGGYADIYVMNASGGDVRRLTSASAHDAYPDWSPDGSRVVFCSNRTGSWEIFVMNADGSGATQLTFEDSFAGSPRWSPDGTQIVFEADWDGDTEIYVMNADGGNVRQLTDNDADDRRPCWRP